MKLASVTVKNYRSIIETEKIFLSNLTVLIGPNNEGKSNILRAIRLALSAFAQFSTQRGRWISPYNRAGRKDPMYLTESYKFERDYPLSLQKNESKNPTNLELEFELTKEEINKFYDKTNVKLKKNLSVSITYNKEKRAVFSFEKNQGKFQKLRKNWTRVIEFIEANIDFEYIPAMRSTKDVLSDTVRRTIMRTLDSEHKKEEYLNIRNKILGMEQAALDSIQESITKSIKLFIPSVKKVGLSIDLNDDRDSYFKYRDFDIKIDDGVETNIVHKGDGIQNLAALSLIKETVDRKLLSKQVILAIEEPEAHLHPHAIHELKKLVSNIANSQQVIVATHSPIFVNKTDISSNIIVTNNKARSAKSLEEIKNILGIQLPDNLTSTELTILVEGESDLRFLEFYFKANSKNLSQCLKDGILSIRKLRGTAKPAHEIAFYKDLALSDIFLVLDNDKAANHLITDLKTKNVITDFDYRRFSIKDKKESELEDAFKPSLYSQVLLDLGVDINCKQFKKSKARWTSRVRDCFTITGIEFNETLVKTKVMDAIINSFKERDLIHKEMLHSLIKTIETRLCK